MFGIIKELCDRHENGEISTENLERLLKSYESHVAFIESNATVINELGEVFKCVECGPGTKMLRVA